MNRLFKDQIKNKEFKIFITFFISILIVPVIFYVSIRRFFETHTIPAFLTVFVIILIKIGYIVFVFHDKTNFNYDEQKIDKKNK